MNQLSYEDKAAVGTEAAPLTDWAKEPGVLDLQADLQMAQPAHDGHVERVRRWLDLRNITGKAKPKEAENRSKVQPKMVRRQAEWRYPALSEPFLSSPKLYDIGPVTWEDVKSAHQNELVINSQFRTKINKVAFIDEYVRTAVDEGTCAVRVGWKREEVTEQVEVPAYEFYPAQTEQEIQALQQAAQLETENPQGFEELPDVIKEAVSFSREKGSFFMAAQNGTMMVEETRVVKNHPTLDFIHYENLYLDPSANGDLSKAGFAIISFETSKAELLKDGRYKNLDKVNWDSQSPLHVPDHATYGDRSLTFRDEVRKRVVAFEYWGWYDVNGDENLVPIVATWIGNVMIRMEENPFPDQQLPIVLVPYLPVKGEVTGEPDAELLEENQSIQGAVLRGMIDLMARSANGQTAHAKGFLDVVNRRRYEAGKDYEFNPGLMPDQGIFTHKYPEIPASALTMLQLQNQEAEALTGVKSFSGGMSGDAYGQVASGIRGMLDAAGMREMSILRRLAKGMEDIGRKIIAMNAVFLSEEEVVQITNEEFITISREDLVGEHNVIVDISTSSVDEAKAQDLGFMLQTLGNTVPWEITKKILAEIARLKRMPELAHDIKQFAPQPDPVQEALKQLEVAKVEAEIARIKTQSLLDQAKARQAMAQADLSDLDFVEQETGTKHARDRDLQQAQGEANQKLEITKAMLQPKDPEGKHAKPEDIATALGYQQLDAALTGA